MSLMPPLAKIHWLKLMCHIKLRILSREVGAPFECCAKPSVMKKPFPSRFPGKQLRVPKVLKKKKKKKNILQNKRSATSTSEPSSSSVDEAAETAELFWIRIRNVHKKVAYADIVRAIFQRCVHLRSKDANPSILGGHFQDTVEVAFATKGDAKEAVSRFRNQIKLFRKKWRITHCKPKRSSDAAFSFDLRAADIQMATESSDGGSAKRLKQTIQNVAVGHNAKVAISSIDDRVPIEVVLPLFKTAGSILRSHEIYYNPRFIVLEYEQSKDAVAAAKMFYDTINFFGKTWLVSRASAGDGGKSDDDAPAAGDGDDGDDDDDEDDDDEDEDEDEDEDNDDDDDGSESEDDDESSKDEDEDDDSSNDEDTDSSQDEGVDTKY